MNNKSSLEERKYQYKFPSGLWLIIASISLILISTIYIKQFGLINSIFLLSIISGMIFAFTISNDKRIVGGRILIHRGKPFKDMRSRLLDPYSFVAIVGILGTFSTWLLLPLFYRLFANPLNYPVNLLSQDICKAFSLPLLGLPTLAFIVTGVTTLVYTVCYLEIVKRGPLTYFVVAIVIAYVLDMIIGIFYFQEMISHFEKILIPIILILSVPIWIYSSDIKEKTEKKKEKIFSGNKKSEKKMPIRLLWILLTFLISSITIDFITRYSLGQIDGTRRFFVSLSFRALYFSILGIFGIFYFAYQALFRQQNPFNKWSALPVIGITVITFICSFGLKVPTYAYNLVIAPLAFLIGQVLLLPIIGAWYHVEGFHQNLIKRLYEAFGSLRDQENPNFRSVNIKYVGLYILMVIILTIWCFLKYFYIKIE